MKVPPAAHSSFAVVFLGQFPRPFSRIALLAALLSLASVARAESIAIDFGRQVATSSSLLFGGCEPGLSDERVWDRLEAAGVRFVRIYAFVPRRFRPAGTTLEEYRAALGRPGGIADLASEHWDWSELDTGLRHARSHGIKVLLAGLETLPWLGYTRTAFSPPRDWPAYEDFIAQFVRRFADRVDYWGIWNEPNGPEFMKLANSPYPEGKDGMLAAYVDVCRHALAAIERTGLKVRIGGPALATWNSEPFIDKFLAHDDVARRFDYISHHIYFHTPVPNRCFPPAIGALMEKHGLEPRPLFITEWNSQSSVNKRPHVFKNSPESVGWVGKSFVLLLRWGVQGAAFYNFNEGRALDDRLGGAYTMVDGQPRLFRFMKVFHLLSQVLGLGERDGTIRVFDSRVAGLAEETALPPNFADSLYAVGCVNAQETPVIVVANPSAVDRPAALSAALPDGSYRVKAFVVRPDHAPEEVTQPTPLFERTLTAAGGGLALDFPVPAHSVVGLRLERAVPPS